MLVEALSALHLTNVSFPLKLQLQVNLNSIAEFQSANTLKQSALGRMHDAFAIKPLQCTYERKGFWVDLLVSADAVLAHGLTVATLPHPDAPELNQALIISCPPVIVCARSTVQSVKFSYLCSVQSLRTVQSSQDARRNRLHSMLTALEVEASRLVALSLSLAFPNNLAVSLGLLNSKPIHQKPTHSGTMSKKKKEWKTEKGGQRPLGFVLNCWSFQLISSLQVRHQFRFTSDTRVLLPLKLTLVQPSHLTACQGADSAVEKLREAARLFTHCQHHVQHFDAVLQEL